MKIIEEVGHVYGFLTVIEKATILSLNSPRGGARWECRCRCGNIVIALGVDLRSGRVTSCGCEGSRLTVGLRFGQLVLLNRTDDGQRFLKRWQCKCLGCGGETVVPEWGLLKGRKTCGCHNIPRGTKKDETGKRYGMLTVVSEAGIGKGTNYAWLCKCDCGNTITADGASLRAGRTRSCGCKLWYVPHSLPNGEAGFRLVVRSYKNNATRRKLDFLLSDEECKKLFEQVCHYCGSKPTQISKAKNGDYIYNGIDRIDNTKGYVITNVVTCCGLCNQAKNDLSFDDFLNLCQRVVAKHGVSVVA